MDETLLERCPLSRPVRDVKNLNRLFLLFHAEQNPVAAENQVSDFVAVETAFKSHRATVRRLLQRLDFIVNGKIPTRRIAGRILRDVEIDFLDLFRRLGGNLNPVRHRASNRASSRTRERTRQRESLAHRRAPWRRERFFQAYR